MSAPFVTAIVPCRNEERYIRACLDSILGSDYPRDRLEVIVADGMSDDRTRAIIAEFAARDSRVQLLDNLRRIVPSGLNAAIRIARGDIIVRMDAHAFYPPEYLAALVRALAETGADNVGGRLVTLPADDSAEARAIALAMSHPLGVGNSYFRIGVHTRRWVDTVQFGCYRRDVFDRIGLFDEELIRNQDDEFNARLLTRGGRILLIPDVSLYYYARRTLRQVARMCYQYGVFKPLAARKVGRITTVRQLVPPAFLLTVVGLAALSPWHPTLGVTLGGLLALYAAAVAGCAAWLGRHHGPACATWLGAVFPTMHVSYGLGFLRGLVGLLNAAGTRSPDATAVPLSR